MNKEKVVYVDSYGWFVDKDYAQYKVTLTGSYCWLHIEKTYWHEIEKIEQVDSDAPTPLFMNGLISKTLLFV